MKMAIRNISKNEPCYIKDYGKELYIYTIKDFKEFAHIDTEKQVIYFNTRLKGKHGNIKTYLKKKYPTFKTSEYFNL